MKNGLVDGNVSPEILNESAATAWVDGKNALGAVVGNFCMDLAIRKAKDVGVGWVVAKSEMFSNFNMIDLISLILDSNHYGIAGMYSVQAMKEGLIGMSFTNASPIVVANRSKEVIF